MLNEDEEISIEGDDVDIEEEEEQPVDDSFARFDDHEGNSLSHYHQY